MDGIVCPPLGFWAGGALPFPSVTNLYAHWDFQAANVTKTTTVSAVTDLSGNGRTLAQSTSGNQPTWNSADFNGYDSASFDNSNDFMYVTVAQAQPLDIWMACILPTWTNNDGLLSLRDSSVDGTDLRVSNSGVTPQVKQFGSSIGNTISPTLGNRVLIRASFNGASSFLQLNGGTKQTGTNPGTGDATYIIVGAHGLAPSGVSDIKVAKICVFSAVKSSTEETDLTNFFLNNYAIS